MCNIISLLNHWVRELVESILIFYKKTGCVLVHSFRKLQCYSKGMGFIFPNENDEEKKK